MTKQDFQKFWNESSRENILNQYYYDYVYLQGLKQALNEIRKCCEDNAIEVNTHEYGNLIVTNTEDILQIIDKALGDEK